jgi:hypothetical protein
MSASAAESVVDAALTQRLSHGLVAFLETNTLPDGLMQPDVFCDLSLPQWRLQTTGADAVERLRRESHPERGTVPRWSAEPTQSGFVFEFEERWTDAQGESWYCRELLRAKVRDGRIAEISIYCTGDWDRAKQAEHARAVTLSRP